MIHLLHLTSVIIAAMTSAAFAQVPTEGSEKLKKTMEYLGCAGGETKFDGKYIKIKGASCESPDGPKKTDITAYANGAISEMDQ